MARAAGGARGSVRAALHREPDLGCPQQSGQDAALQLRQDRPTRGRPADRSQAAGPAGLHPGGMGRRVRTPAAVTDHGLRRGRPRPRPQRLQRLDGGRRRQGGTTYGATDEFGHKAVENRVSVHDFHATILHQLGMSFRDLAYERHGLHERLTDQFPARVVTEVLPEPTSPHSTHVRRSALPANGPSGKRVRRLTRRRARPAPPPTACTRARGPGSPGGQLRPA